MFLPPQIVVAQQEIRLNCTLSNAFPGELGKLAATATPIYIYVFIEFREEGRRQPLKKVAVESRLLYDMIDKQYCITQSCRSDTLCFGALDSATAVSCSFRGIPVIGKNELKKDGEYTVSMYAVLGKTRVEALNNREIDCMYYWDYKRPSVKTETIGGNELLGADK